VWPRDAFPEATLLLEADRAGGFLSRLFAVSGSWVTLLVVLSVGGCSRGLPRRASVRLGRRLLCGIQ
jgi:hypothetical protein